MFHLPQGAPETQLLMVLAFIRLRQGLPGTGRESQATEKNIFMKKSLEFNFQGR